MGVLWQERQHFEVASANQSSTTKISEVTNAWEGGETQSTETEVDSTSFQLWDPGGSNHRNQM